VVPIACWRKLEYGTDSCGVDCPGLSGDHVFQLFHIKGPEDIPGPEERAIDVAILDMNCGWPNMGHDSIVYALRETACDLLPLLQRGGLRLRCLSYDVRASQMIPAPPGGRFALYVGTGGPGHIDPHKNDGTSEGTQGVREDPSWEEPAFALFDAVLRSEAALLAVCHTFGVLCRWSGVAQPHLRGPSKGGKSSGILENLLTPEGMTHPWFQRFGRRLPHGRLRVVENRLYDLIPDGNEFPAGILPIGYETEGPGGPRGDAITMLEFARDACGVMPRVFAVNHHPEIVDRPQQMLILKRKLAQGDVTPEWFAERARILTQTDPEGTNDRRLRLTSDYTFLAPLRFYVYREIRRRAEGLHLDTDLHEDSLLDDPDWSSAGQTA